MGSILCFYLRYINGRGLAFIQLWRVKERLPGLELVKAAANVSVIRSICCASPGSLKLSSSSLIASAIGFWRAR